MRHIFVFGSNLAGRHGKGAAKEAHELWGAEYGVGEGLTGNSYAIPTKDKNLKTRGLIDISISIFNMLNFAKNNPDMMFFITPIGTGLAGYDRKEIANLFAIYNVSNNVVFTHHWFDRNWWGE